MTDNAPLLRRYQYPAMALSLFLAYLAVTLPLSILSILVTRDWGLDIVYGGLAVGSTFFSTILSRKYTGGIVDRRGGKTCFLAGIAFYGAASLLCVAAAWEALPIMTRFYSLIAGRLLLGIGESLANTSMVSWMVAMRGTENTGRVMAMVGMAMYAAFACGGPLGFFVFERFGFGTLMLFAATLPAAGYILVKNAVPYAPDARPAVESFLSVIGRIWNHGVVLSLQGVGLSVIGAFMSQMFVAKGWAYAGWGLTCFGGAFVVLRIACGHLPDKIGGLPVALGSIAVEMVGLYLVWLAPGPAAALVGAALAGAGCSMIYPSLGREVVLATPAELRGTSLGCFAAFQDLAYGLAGPAAGFLADYFGLQRTFLFAALAATLGLVLTLRLMRRTTG